MTDTGLRVEDLERRNRQHDGHIKAIYSELADHGRQLREHGRELRWLRRKVDRLQETADWLVTAFMGLMNHLGMEPPPPPPSLHSDEEE